MSLEAKFLVNSVDTRMAESTEDSQPAEPMDEAAAVEARRRRREAIKAKYRSQASPMHLKALQVPGGETDSSTTGTEPMDTSTQGSPSMSHTPTPLAQPFSRS